MVEMKMQNDNRFAGKTLLITGGTGSFGGAVLNRFLRSDVKDNSAVEALNKGLAHATGEIVGMCNGDDWYADGILAHMAKAFENGADAAYGDLISLDKDGKPYFTCTEPQNGIEWPSTVLFVRLEVLRKLGGISESYKWLPDWALCMEMMLEGMYAVHVPYDCAYFSWGGVSTNNKHIWGFLREYIRLRDEYLPKFVTKGLSAPDLNGQVDDIRRWAWGIFIHMRCLRYGFSYGKKMMRERNKNGIAIWGAGGRGKMCLKWLGKETESVDCFIDSNPNTEELEGIPVYRYDCDKLRDKFIIITPLNHTEEIAATLRKDVFVEGVDFISYMRYRYEEMVAYVQKFNGMEKFDIDKVGLDENGIDELNLERR